MLQKSSISALDTVKYGSFADFWMAKNYRQTKKPACSGLFFDGI